MGSCERADDCHVRRESVEIRKVICTGTGTSLYGLISVMRHASSWSRKKHELADKPYLAAAA